MIETEILTFPLEGKDKFIAEMKIFNAKFTRREPDYATVKATFSSLVAIGKKAAMVPGRLCNSRLGIACFNPIFYSHAQNPKGMYVLCLSSK